MEDLAKNYTLKRWFIRLKHDFTLFTLSPDFPMRVRKSLLIFGFIYLAFAIRGCESYSILVENIELCPLEYYSHEIYEPSVVEIRPGLSRLTLDRKAEHWQALFTAGIGALMVFFNSKPEEVSAEKCQPQDQQNPQTSGPVV